MGSGENWGGHHVPAHFALNRLFRQKNALYLAFLILDQPSQAHYPVEQNQNGNIEQLPDDDREAVYKLFKLISDVAKELSPSFQVIIMDHADLRETWC